jgi:hypothetical protein
VLAFVVPSHEVEGVSYLRADYSAECGDETWKVYAVYSSMWLICYVIAFPAYILWSLFSYRHDPNNSSHALGFLMDDFKLVAPALSWEGIEMIRKLLLSVLGAFWSTK